MLDTAFKSIGDVFSKVFLGGYFFPALLTVLLNVAIYLTGVAGIEEGLKLATEKLRLKDLASTLGLTSVLAVTLAFLFAPFSGGLRNLLAGKIDVPVWRGGRLSALEDNVRQLKKDIAEAQKRHADYLDAAIALETKLQIARDAGAKKRSFRKPELVDTAEAALAALEKQLRECARAGAKADLKSLPGLRDGVVAALEAVLSANQTTRNPEKPRPWDDLSERVEKVMLGLLGGLGTMDRMASSRLVAATQALYANFDPDNIQATRFGNFCAVMEAYPRRVYGLAYDYVAPRLDLALSADDGVFSVLDRARIEVESALTFFALVTLSLLIWVSVLWPMKQHVLTLWVIALTAPVVIAFLHEFVVQAQQRFAERFVAVLDARRFDVMQALHVPLPVDVAAERIAWEQVQALSGGSRSVNFAFAHPEATA